MNRAQLKALAARQAMTTAPAATARQEPTPAAPATLDTAALLPRARRRVVLTREQEYTYIRRDLIRLAVISVGLLLLLVVLLVVLR